MSSNLAIKAGRKLFQKNLRDYTPADPLYETYTDAKGRQKRRKRQLPPGLSARDAKILKSVMKRAHYLDKGFSLCGMRFGWTFVIGIIPGAGDVADAALNYILVVRKAREAEIPGWLLRRMLVNNVISAAAGSIPVAGDIILAAFKANSRNAALLEEFLRIRGEEFLKLQSERAEDPVQVKPGAGREPGEKVPGKDGVGTAGPAPPGVGKKASGGWFRKRSKAKECSAGRGVARQGTADSRGSRFIEDMPADTMTSK